MKLEILQENLAKAVSVTSRFASTKAQLPILGNILISTKSSKVFISSTNLEISAAVSIGAKIEEEGEVSVPSKVITDLVSNLPSGTISLEAEKEQLKISANGFSSTILGMNTSDFPKIPNLLDKEKALVLPKKELSDALSQVSFAASLDETRPVLTGVLFIWSKDLLTLVATDGFRLSRKSIKFSGKSEDSRLILPKPILSEISKSGDGDSILFDHQEKEKQAVFGVGDVVLTSRLLEGEYPDFEKIIPKEFKVKVLADKEEFLRSVKLASVFARDAANVVKIKLLKDSLKISAENGQSGSQETKVDSKNEGDIDGFEISFNYRFLEDFLHSVRGEEIQMDFSATTTAGVFTDTSDSSYLHLIMPVRV